MKLTIADVMPALRQAKRDAIEHGFNVAAFDTLHRDLVALARGDATAIEAREAKRQQSLAAIEAAATLAELDAVGQVLSET